MEPFRNPIFYGYRIALAFWLAIAVVAVPGHVSTASAPAIPQGGNPFLYSISPRDNILRVIDPASMATLGAVMIRLPGQVIEGATGLASHPTTGELFSVLKIEGQTGQRELVEIDPTTGLATDIGNTGDNFSALAFTPDGTLYGVTGDGASTSETLFTISITDATPSLFLALGNGDDGEIIAYNPDDGLMYHASGRLGLNGATNRIFESINLTSTAVTTITLPPGTPDEEVAAMIYQGGGNFLYADINDVWYNMTTAGTVVTLTTDLDHESHGLAFSSLGPPPQLSCASFEWFGAINSDTTDGALYGIDLATGAGNWIGPVGFNNVSSLELSADGTLYGVGQDISGTAILLTIDRCTGQGTAVGPLSGGFNAYTDAAFRNADEVLFGYVESPDQTLVTITVSTGVVITVGTTSLSEAGNGLAFSSADTLYHANETSLNTLDQSTGLTITTMPLSYTAPLIVASSVEALEFDSTDTLYAVVHASTSADDEFYLATIDIGTGVVTSVGQSVSGLDALVFAPLNKLYLPLILR